MACAHTLRNRCWFSATTTTTHNSEETRRVGTGKSDNDDNTKAPTLCVGIGEIGAGGGKGISTVVVVVVSKCEGVLTKFDSHHCQASFGDNRLGDTTD